MTSQYQYTQVSKYLITIHCEQPLHVGSAEGGKEGILINPVTGLPFLQAYGMIGAMREYCRRIYGEDTSDDLFGRSEQETEKDQTGQEKTSKVKITDGITRSGDYKTELRPHVKIDGKTGTADTALSNQTASGQKFEMLYVSAGASFCFRMYYYGKDDTGEDEKILENCLSGIHAGEIQFGGKKSAGCGTFSIIRARKYKYDLRSETDRARWFRESPEEEGESEDITRSLQEKVGGCYVLELTGRTRQGILARSIVSLDTDHGKEKTENIENGRGEYILPGSSIKGVLQNRVKMILSYQERPLSISDDMFGKESGEDDKGSVGNTFFMDCVVGGPVTAGQYRIHIDKFTGGTFYSSLFHEFPVSGEIKIKVKVKDHDERKAKISCGLLLLAFRDVALGEVSFGSGASIGRGFLDVSAFSLEHKEKKAMVDWAQKKVTGNEQIITECLDAYYEEERSCI